MSVMLSQASPATSPPMSRIDCEVARIRDMTTSVQLIQDRLLRHAHSLGFYNAENKHPDAPLAAMPVDLHSALDRLDEAITAVNGALNVFD